MGDFSIIYADLEKQRSSSDGWVPALCTLQDDHEHSFAFNRENRRYLKGQEIWMRMGLMGMNLNRAVVRMT